MKTSLQDVDNFVSIMEHPDKVLVNSIRKLIKDLNLPLVEGIKWNAPSYSLDGNDIITFNFKTFSCIALVFHTGPKGKDTHNGTTLFHDEYHLLEWVADKRAVLKIKDSSDLLNNTKQIEDIVTIWVNHAKNSFVV